MCALELAKMDFDGYAIGGTSIGEPKDVCFKIYNEMTLIKNIKGSFDYKKNRFGTNYLYKCYRCLLICYIINNNSYELTEAQKTMLNAVHDIKEMPDKLWKFCIELIEREVGFII